MGLFIKKSEKFQFSGYLMKISISVLNQVKRTIIHDLLFLIAIYSPKNDNKHPSEMRN